MFTFFTSTYTTNTTITYTTDTSYNTNVIFNTYIAYNTYVTTNITYNTIVTYTTITSTTNTTLLLCISFVKPLECLAFSLIRKAYTFLIQLISLIRIMFLGPSQSSFKMSLKGVQDIFMAAKHKFYCLVALADILEQVFWNGWRKKC